jgi:hypothetical protein
MILTVCLSVFLNLPPSDVRLLIGEKAPGGGCKMTKSLITIDGTISRMALLETRKGFPFIRVRVTSEEMSIDVDIFARDQQRQLDKAMPGDRMRASGSGFHRGPIRRGTTSITAQKITLKKCDLGRDAYKRPKQLSLFAA